MTDLPILFSTPMIRALLEGRKTQTRRLISTKGHANLFDGSWTDDYVLDPGNADWRAQQVRYSVGDRLYVRETWHAEASWDDTKPRDIASDACCVLYPADDRWSDYDPMNAAGKTRVSIHMPRWASRLTLTVTDVRVQRLLDITEEDARAESFSDGKLDDGFGPRDMGDGWTVESSGTLCSAAGMFQIYWQKLHPDWDGYDSPWVVALTFTVDQRNIDAQVAA